MESETCRLDVDEKGFDYWFPIIFHCGIILTIEYGFPTILHGLGFSNNQKAVTTDIENHHLLPFLVCTDAALKRLFPIGLETLTDLQRIECLDNGTDGATLTFDCGEKGLNFGGF